MNQQFDALAIIASSHERELLEEAASVRLVDALTVDNYPHWGPIGNVLCRALARFEALLGPAHVRRPSAADQV